MSNAKWRISFPDAYVKNLPRTTSDRCLVIVFIAGRNKVNTDGSVNKLNDKCGFGGIIRDAEANWLGGFYGKLDECTSLEAEIHVMFVGVEVLKSKHLEETILETDSQVHIVLSESIETPSIKWRPLLEM